MHNFDKVVAWQKAYQFTLMVYKATRNFPQSELFGLTSQFKRASVSIPANIAEGYKKISKADKLRFYNIAQGSLEECRCYVYLSKDLGYIDEELFTGLISHLEDTSRMLNYYCKGVISKSFQDE